MVPSRSQSRRHEPGLATFAGRFYVKKFRSLSPSLFRSVHRSLFRFLCSLYGVWGFRREKRSSTTCMGWTRSSWPWSPGPFLLSFSSTPSLPRYYFVSCFMAFFVFSLLMSMIVFCLLFFFGRDVDIGMFLSITVDMVFFFLLAVT